jgi:hypothetical protein
MNAGVLANFEKKIELLREKRIIIVQIETKEREGSIDEPRPATISARPFEIKSRVANSWKTRTGSAALRTVTALVKRIF